MKQFFSIFLAITLTACAAQNSDNGSTEGGSVEDSITSGSGSDTGYGNATLSFRGSTNEERSYGPSSSSNSMVGCIQHSGTHHAEISVVTAKENQDARNPSNWLNSFELNFSSSKIPTGRIVVDSQNSNAYINYRVMKDSNSSTSYFPADNCILDISKNGNSISMDINCRKLISSKNDSLAISGHIDCSIFQM